MEATLQHRRIRYRLCSTAAGLLVLLTAMSAWSSGKGLQAEDTRPRRATPGRAVVVQEGRLSVDVQAADLGEVLAQIGRQAGIRISAGPSAGKQITAQFTDVELEEGFRRLLRLASLSHLFLYAQGPEGTVAITEVRVLGEGAAESPRAAPVARPGFSAAREVPEPVRDVVESAPEPTPKPGQAEPSEAVRRVLDAFTRSKQMGASSPDGQDASPPEPRPSGQEPGDGEGGAR
jgi:type II secretory pathway component GspD/PulD (secretin)